MNDLKDAIEYIHTLGSESGKPQFAEVPGFEHLLLMPKDTKIESLEQYFDAPLRAKESRTVIDIKSFMDYIQRFDPACQDVAIFANLDKCTISAVLDYHKKGLPKWGQHVVTLDCKLTHDWNKWVSHNGKQMAQTEFAEFIEDMSWTILEPDAATITELCLAFESSKSAVFESKVNRTNGEVQFVYKEEIGSSAKGTMRVPEKFHVAVNVFQGSKPVDMEARLRYRVKEQSLTFFYVLDRPDRVKLAAFEGVLAEIEALSAVRPMLCP